jgi:hypothetical protein
MAYKRTNKRRSSRKQRTHKRMRGGIFGIPDWGFASALGIKKATDGADAVSAPASEPVAPEPKPEPVEEKVEPEESTEENKEEERKPEPAIGGKRSKRSSKHRKNRSTTKR